MKSWFGCLSFVTLLITGGCVFITAQRMHQTQVSVLTLKREIAQEQDHLRVLQAEWTYLNNPDRLEKLAATFGLQPLDGKQYVAINDVPTQSAMQEIELAAAAKAEKQTLRQQQFAAASQPVDRQKVEQALALAAADTTSTAMAAAMPASLNVPLADVGAE
jgi:cell division protein FtsL